MPKITYITPIGTEHCFDADSRSSAMQTAVQHRIPGIDGDCGGVADCGNCHVWVDQNWLERIGPARAGIEAEMLALTDGSTPFSRLACQIELADEHEGLVLRMPTDQH
ncbi:MAG: 2Fe-2S iron-sulfur cluster-binding protein [Nevskia sp.]|nr:2Fe-2S iron-sulfur cluster-binding protein [Nevskia sp.]